MFALWPLITATLTWLFRQVLIKLVVLAIVASVIAYLLPWVWGKLSPFLGINLSSYFSALPSGVWYFLDFANLGYGLPLILSAIVARFLIRRIPFVG